MRLAGFTSWIPGGAENDDLVQRMMAVCERVVVDSHTAILLGESVACRHRSLHKVVILGAAGKPARSPSRSAFQSPRPLRERVRERVTVERASLSANQALMPRGSNFLLRR